LFKAVKLHTILKVYIDWS